MSETNKLVMQMAAGTEDRPKSFWQRVQNSITGFFMPQPVLVPAQMKTPEIDLDTATKPLPLRGQLIYMLIGLFFIIAVIWAWQAELDEVVRADGEIIPSSDVQLVQTRLPGSVVDIAVQLGDRVSKGDVLFRIEDEDVIANFDDNEINRLTALATISRLKAEAAGLKEPVFPGMLRQAAPDMVQQEEAVFRSRRQSIEARRAVITQDIETLRRSMAEKRAEAEVAGRQVATLKEELAILQPLVDAGHEPKTAVLSIRSRLDEAEGRQQLAGLAQMRLESDLEKQKRELASIEANFRAEAEASLVEAQTVFAQAESRLEALRGKVAHTDIKAPTDGTVSAVHLKTIGGVVDAGSVLAEIVPIDEELTIRARLLAEDIADATPGQKVRVSLSAYDATRYGMLEGYVEKVASNSTQEENMPPYYLTMIKVPDPVFEKSGLRPEIIPGMTVMVDMLGNKRTVLEYLLTPIKKAQNIAFREK